MCRRNCTGSTAGSTDQALGCRLADIEGRRPASTHHKVPPALHSCSSPVTRYAPTICVSRPCCLRYSSICAISRGRRQAINQWAPAALKHGQAATARGAQTARGAASSHATKLTRVAAPHTITSFTPRPCSSRMSAGSEGRTSMRELCACQTAKAFPTSSSQHHFQ